MASITKDIEASRVYAIVFARDLADGEQITQASWQLPAGLELEDSWTNDEQETIAAPSGQITAPPHTVAFARLKLAEGDTPTWPATARARCVITTDQGNTDADSIELQIVKR